MRRLNKIVSRSGHYPWCAATLRGIIRTNSTDAFLQYEYLRVRHVEYYYYSSSTTVNQQQTSWRDV